MPPLSFIISTYTTTELFMTYTTEQFKKNVQELRDLIKMCDELENKQNIHTDYLIDQFNGEKAFFWRAK